MTATCLNCNNRYAGCHANCETYKAWKSEQLASAEAKRKAKETQSLLNSYAAKAARKYMRKKMKER